MGGRIIEAVVVAERGQGQLPNWELGCSRGGRLILESRLPRSSRSSVFHHNLAAHKICPRLACSGVIER